MPQIEPVHIMGDQRDLPAPTIHHSVELVFISGFRDQKVSKTSGHQKKKNHSN